MLGVMTISLVTASLKQSGWQTLSKSGTEASLTFWRADTDKKTEIGWIPPLNSCSSWEDKYIYNQSGGYILDDKNKSIQLKCESGKCLGSNCYHISLTDAQAININDYIKLGDTSYIVIYLIGASELDENRSFIRDIFPYVGFLDGNYTAIDNGNFIKAIFETNLTSKNDIRILAKSNKTSSVDIYLNNEIIANISNILSAKYYSTLLTNLGTRTSDTFFLKCIGEIYFDYIIDPAFCAGNLDCSVWNGIGFKTTCEAHTLCTEEGFVSCSGTAGCEGYGSEAECLQHGGEGCIPNGYTCINNGLCSDLTDEPTCTSYNEANCLWDATAPILSFVSPTPTNGSQTSSSVIINVSVSENNLQSAWINLDNTNYTASCSVNSPDYRCYYSFTGLTAGWHNFTAYANDTGNQIGSSESRTFQVITNSCIAPSGNWNLNCSDNCSFTSNQKVAGNITITGIGHIDIKSNFTFNSTNQYIKMYPGCQINRYPGSRFP
jgi:hypothetical protein